MNHFQKIGRLFFDAILLRIRYGVVSVARFVHLGVTLNAQDDAFWAGVCYLLLAKSLIWLLQYQLDNSR